MEAEKIKAEEEAARAESKLNEAARAESRLKNEVEVAAIAEKEEREAIEA